jgi:hypothetical protein
LHGYPREGKKEAVSKVQFLEKEAVFSAEDNTVIKGHVILRTFFKVLA